MLKVTCLHNALTIPLAMTLFLPVTFLDVGMSEKTKSAVLSCYACDRSSDGTP